KRKAWVRENILGWRRFRPRTQLEHWMTEDGEQSLSDFVCALRNRDGHDCVVESQHTVIDRLVWLPRASGLQLPAQQSIECRPLSDDRGPCGCGVALLCGAGLQDDP